ncbi:hypothetical protein BG844_05735 [Couchioplanes caeruleus subsp. caeruleus]|uniref:Uncharacterized protein n=1 Tax=Couchioplanes caeruleus subsp. caeruleus TaxID=56427 RepID=A0A1K0FQV8_9ACTN|nr:hypothetical protein BG844_05735 [Couchioplanes caeruleus subsp. caeruleus]
MCTSPRRAPQSHRHITARRGKPAAEHFAYGPDDVWQGAGTLTAFADQLVDAPLGRFGWG